MRISDWSSDVCSSDLCNIRGGRIGELEHFGIFCLADDPAVMYRTAIVHRDIIEQAPGSLHRRRVGACHGRKQHQHGKQDCRSAPKRSEEHTSELQSLMRISYAVFCLKKKNKKSITKHDKL